MPPHGSVMAGRAIMQAPDSWIPVSSTAHAGLSLHYQIQGWLSYKYVCWTHWGLSVIPGVAN